MSCAAPCTKKKKRKKAISVRTALIRRRLKRYLKVCTPKPLKCILPGCRGDGNIRD